MIQRHPRFFAVLWMILVVVLLTLGFSAAYILTGYLYTITGLRVPELIVQIINSFLGLLLAGLVIAAFSHSARMRQINAFQPIILALERIAKGDFSIRLEDEHGDGILSSLVASVNKMARELDQMENMRQEFISNVSHEIQSPLTSIRGFAQALQDDRLPPADRQHYLEIIETEGRRLSRLTEDLLNLAALDAEQVKFEPRPFRLDQQIRSILLNCEPQWRDKAIVVEADLDEISIRADEDLLSQVWINLIHNSIKFTPRGGAIRVSLARNGETVEFKIADNGIGIAPQDQVHIFERFYKADKSRTRAQGGSATSPPELRAPVGVSGGSGLGLSIVKKIVELHQGKIDLVSQLGLGSTFSVSLPCEEKH